jgi:hypothetical protein
VKQEREAKGRGALNVEEKTTPFTASRLSVGLGGLFTRKTTAFDTHNQSVVEVTADHFSVSIFGCRSNNNIGDNRHN